MALFDEAADLEGAAREDYFRALAEQEPELARELRALFAYEPTTTQGARTGDGIRVMGSFGHGAVPDTDGRFEIVRMLGEGGMGTVYLAQQKQPWRRVALKVLKGELASERVRRRFAAEGDILARLSHPGIASVYEAVDSGAEPYLVMEYVDGIPLGEWKARTKPDLRTQVQLLIKIAEAVDHAHRSGVVHRDLKPANILVTADGTPKVLDFGIARVMDPDRVSDSSITQAGEIIGTPAYMSPEQASLDPSRIDHRTDVYVLGVVSYEFLTDYMPYPIDSDLMLNLTRIRALSPTMAGKLAPSLRGDLEVILDKALQKAPEARYQSAAAFADDLGRWLRGETILARPPSVLYQIGKFARRNRLLVLAFSALFVALVVGAIATTMLWLEGRRTQRELERRVDDLVLLQARETLPTDATRAVEMMRALGPGADWAKAYAIGWDARGRGVSEEILKGHEADVEWVDVAADGAIASASFDGTVRVWRGGVGTVFSGHEGGVNRVAWSSRGVLASAGRDGTVRIWPGGEVVHRHEDECEEIAWAPDGSALASVGGDGVVALTVMSPRSTRELMRSEKALSAVLWRGDMLVAGGKAATLVRIDRPLTDAVVRRLEGHKAEVDILGVFMDGEPLLASGASDGELRIWDGDAVRSFPSPEGSPLKGVEFLSRNQVATVDRAGTLRIWDLLRGTAASFGGGGVYRDLTVSPDRSWLATASDDRTTVLWDVQTLDPIVLRGHRDAVLHVEIANDRLVSSGKEGDLRVWSLPTRRTRWPLAAVPRAMAVAGSELVIVDESGGLSRGSLGSGEMVEIDDGIDGHVVHWSNDGSRFLTSLRQGVVQVRAADGRKLSQLELPGRPIMGAFSADDQRMAVVTNDGSLALVGADVAIHTLPCGRANAVAFVGASVAIGCRDGALLRFDGKAFSEVARLPGEVDHIAAQVGASGAWLVAAGTDEARMWRVDVEPWQTMGGTHHTGPIHALALVDGRLVSGSRDGVIKVLSGGVEQALLGHSAGVTSLVLHGDTLISGSRDRTVRIWDLTSGAAAVIDLFEGPITGLALASSVAGGPIDRVVVMADEKAISAWPLRLEQVEATVRAFLDGLVHRSPEGPREIR